MGSPAKKAPSGPFSDKPYRAALRVAVKRKENDDAKGKTKLDRIALALVQQACDGDVPAIKEIGDRLDGKVPQALVGGGADDNPVRVITEVRRTIVDPAQKGS